MEIYRKVSIFVSVVNLCFCFRFGNKKTELTLHQMARNTIVVKGRT